jgi:hypothetical protein
MQPARFEPAIPPGYRSQTHPLDSAATWIIFRPAFYVKQIKVVSLIILLLLLLLLIILRVDRRYHNMSKYANEIYFM